MTEPSGPATTRPGTLADLRARQQHQTSEAMARWEAQQIEQATAFGQKYGHALTEGLRSTKNAFLDERNQTAQQIRQDQETIRRLSGQLTTTATHTGRLLLAASLAVSAVIIICSLLFAWGKVSSANQTPAPATTFTKAGTTYEVLTGPGWTTCSYDGRTRPCRAIKE